MKKVIAVALLASLAATPALAADQGAFVGVDFGKLSMSNTGFENPGAVDLTGGYRFSQYVAIEGGLLIVGNTTLTDAYGSITYAQSAVHASGVFTLPLGESFGLFCKLGVDSVYGKLTGTGSYSYVDSNTTTTNGTYGVGGRFNINQHFAIKAQYESLGKSKASSSASGVDLTRTSVGMIYSF